MTRIIWQWRWALLIGAALLLALGYSLWPTSKVVDLGVVTRGPMTIGIADDGVVREKELYVVTAPVTGFASRIALKAGDQISKGTAITQISARPTQPLDRRTQDDLLATLTAARAAEASAAALSAQADRDVARAEALGPQGFISRAQLEAVRTRVLTEQAAFAKARAEVQRITASLSQPGSAGRGAPVLVTAPVSGSVLLVPSESEGVVAEGTPLLTIGDPAQVEVVVDLLSREAVRVRPGDRVEITEWGGSAHLIGQVKRIEPYGWLKISALGIEEQRVNVIIGFAPQAARAAVRLGHGYQVDATIVVWTNASALRAPIGALFRSKEGAWHVFVDDDGRARDVAVGIGHINDDYAEVRSGLTENDVVVLNPGNFLNEGDRIKRR